MPFPRLRRLNLTQNPDETLNIGRLENGLEGNFCPRRGTSRAQRPTQLDNRACAPQSEFRRLFDQMCSALLGCCAFDRSNWGKNVCNRENRPFISCDLRY